ncbi:MAG: PAS domain-containing protein [Myxococcales bacterium]|nr:PAS domain-containing protein [Myxococcales bacterium]
MSASFPPSTPPDTDPESVRADGRERHSSIDGMPIASLTVDRLFRQSLLFLLALGGLALVVLAFQPVDTWSRTLIIAQSLVLIFSVLIALRVQLQSAKYASIVASLGILASVSLSLHGGPLTRSWPFLAVVPMLLLGLQFGRRGVVFSTVWAISAGMFWTLYQHHISPKVQVQSSLVLALQMLARSSVVAIGGMVVDCILAIVREREAFLIDVFRDIDIGVSVFDVDEHGELRVAALNPRVYQLLGLPKGSLLGKRHKEVLSGAQLQATEPTMSRAVQTGEPQHNEDRVRSGDQHQRLLITAVPQRGKDKQVRRLVVSGTDITLLKDAERKLRFQAEVLANVADAVVAVNPAFRITYVNLAAERLFKVTSKEVLGKPLEEMSGPSFLREFQGQVGEELRVQSGVFLALDGQELPLEFSVSTQFDEDGEIAQHLAVIRDIRDRRSLEAQLARAQKAEALGRLAGGIAHDFNNMLVVISGNTELLAESLPSDHPGQLDLREIKQAADRAAGLIRQLLAFSRRQNGTPRSSDLNQVLRDIYHILQRLIRSDIKLSLDLHDGLWPVSIDVGQLEQVMVQLLLNARDAIPGQGQVVIATRNIVLGEESTRHGLPAGDYVELRVTDSGIGMSAETMKRLFEPFFSTKSSSRSVGLGLSVCYGVIRQNRGVITAESTPGEGSAFVIWLPRAAPQQPSPVLPETGSLSDEFRVSRRSPSAS